MILACKDISKGYGTDIILDKISFNLEEKEKAAVVGVNGAGKTTLFKIITDSISHDDGQLYIPKGTTVGYLEQNIDIRSEKTIYEEMLSVFEPIFKLEEKLRDMENKMSTVSDSDYVGFMEQYSRLQHEFEASDGYSYQSRINGVLKGLGFSEDEYSQSVYTLSGGQKTRVFLGRLLLMKPNLLLLDEPTNHLDIESIQWLEDFLRGYSGSVLIISHDRYFLDRTVTKIIDIENRHSTVYSGNYSFFIKQKDAIRTSQLKQYSEQQRVIKHQEEVIKTLRQFNREKSIKRAESREKALDKMDKLDKPENLPEKMHLHLTPKIQSGNDVLNVNELAMSFDNNKLFTNVSFEIKRGEKVAIIGPNGIGKSTLFKIILGELAPTSGKTTLGVNVNPGYYDQEHHELDDRNTIFDEIHNAYPTMTNGEIRNVLASFVFTGDDVFKTIAALSGGEKGRVSLAKIMLSNSNFLILDEPTNHLDMYSKEILEDAINNYGGTVLYISHDRYFIDKTAERTIELSKDGATQYLGNYSYCLEKKAEKERLAQLEAEDFQKSPNNTTADTLDSKTDWLLQKEEQAKARKKANEIKKVEDEIENTENRISVLNDLLFSPEINSDTEKLKTLYEEKTSLEEKLEGLYAKWEEIQ
ncbi:MAG: ABC-F family ATP-binding cassette domain-containing protein [Candidatus Metalachnospira sp.]|nr:ABC-F family ATP-binding cassette domain-containing protein [Candidatus Metalachnospira sp.]